MTRVRERSGRAFLFEQHEPGPVRTLIELADSALRAGRLSMVHTYPLLYELGSPFRIGHSGNVDQLSVGIGWKGELISGTSVASAGPAGRCWFSVDVPQLLSVMS